MGQFEHFLIISNYTLIDNSKNELYNDRKKHEYKNNDIIQYKFN